MSERKNVAVLVGFVLSISLFTASVTAMLVMYYDNHMYFMMLGNICQEIIANKPEAEQEILAILRNRRNQSLSVLEQYENVTEFNSCEQSASIAEDNILQAYGYRQGDFLYSGGREILFLAGTGFLAGGLLFLMTLLLWRKRDIARIHVLTEYLEKVNTGSVGVLLQFGEDEFSKLQDEIYKTVTELYQARDAALKAKNHFAENLYNIAHQMKTPMTSISLAAQMMYEKPSVKHLEQIRQQISRLSHLEEALLLLSRIDAGTLTLERKDVDVYTILMLAADNLQELFSAAKVSIQIPEAEEMVIYADLDWTMEAMMNLMKNCMEHTPSGGTVYCDYEQNPLYTQIRIWDTGAGFAKEDIPHLFERFFRGRQAEKGGIGIGLALSKAIIEKQNGTISARNLVEGGACYEVRFYIH